MNKEVLKCQTCVLKVNIHCEGCKRKVKRILHEIDGVYKVEAEFGKVTVLGNADPQTLVDKLVKKGKRVEILVAPKPEDNQPSQNKNLQIDNSNGGGKKKKKGNHLQTDNNNGGGNKGTNLQIGNNNGNGGNSKKGKNVQIGNGNGKGGEDKKGKNLQAHNCTGGGGSHKLNLIQNEIVEEDDDDVDTIDSSQLVNKRSGKKPMKDIGQGSGQNLPNTMMKNGNNNGGNADTVNGNQAGGEMANGGGGGKGVGGMQSQSNGYQMVNSFQTTQGNYMPMGNFHTTQMGNCPTTQMSNMQMGNFQMTQMGNNSIGNLLTTQMGNIPMHNFHTTPMGTLPTDQMTYTLVPAQGLDQSGARGGYNPMNTYEWPYSYQHQQQPQIEMVDNERFQPMMMITQPQHVINYIPYSSDPFIMHEVDDKNNPSCNVM